MPENVSRESLPIAVMPDIVYREALPIAVIPGIFYRESILVLFLMDPRLQLAGMTAEEMDTRLKPRV